MDDSFILCLKILLFIAVYLYVV